jgi:hypothetical protein
MGRIRRHLSFANVASAIALFVALGGGTAVALNGQNTVQSDDLGPGAQVKAADVADNAVNGADVVNNSLGGADVKESTLGGLVHGRILDWNGDLGPIEPIATVGPYLISGQCYSNDGTGVRIYAKGPAGNAEAEYNRVGQDTNDFGNHSESATPPANVNTRVVDVGTTAAYTRSGGTLVIRSNSGTIVQVVFSAVADNNTTACHVWGTASTGT